MIINKMLIVFVLLFTNITLLIVQLNLYGNIYSINLFKLTGGIEYGTVYESEQQYVYITFTDMCKKGILPVLVQGKNSNNNNIFIAGINMPGGVPVSNTLIFPQYFFDTGTTKIYTTNGKKHELLFIVESKDKLLTIVNKYEN